MPATKATGENDHPRILGDGNLCGRAGGCEAGVKEVHVVSPRDAMYSRRRYRRGQDGGERGHQCRRESTLLLSKTLHSAKENDTIEPGFQRAGVVNDRRVHFQNGGNTSPMSRSHAFSGEVVLGLENDLDTEPFDQLPHHGLRRPAKAAVREQGASGMKMEPGRGMRRERAWSRPRHHVNFVAASRQSACHLQNVNRPSRRSRERLVAGHVEKLHEESAARRSRKKGPVRMRPKSATSSLMSAVARASGGCVQRPTSGRSAVLLPPSPPGLIGK